MRILFFATFFEAEGNEWHNYADEVLYVIKNYPDTEFIVYTVNSDVDKTYMYSKNILRVERRNLKNVKVAFLFLKDMIKIFTKFKPKVIHAVYIIESIIMGVLGKIFRVPSILHGRGTDVNYFSFISLKSFILAKIGFKINNKIFTVSKAMGNDVIRLKVPPKKVVPVYDGLNFTEFSPKKEKRYLKKEKLEMIHVSRLSFEKCQDLLVEVCKELRDNKYNFHLTIIGEGPSGNLIRGLINKYNLDNWVTMKGLVRHEKIPEYLEKADLYIQPSISEGMPKSVLEAMSMELPIVMTKVGGMRELNIEPGVIYMEKNNKKQLYDGIVYFIKNPEIRKMGGKRNREFILNNFSWDVHAKKLYSIYTLLKRN